MSVKKKEGYWMSPAVNEEFGLKSTRVQMGQSHTNYLKKKLYNI